MPWEVFELCWRKVIAIRIKYNVEVFELHFIKCKFIFKFYSLT